MKNKLYRHFDKDGNLLYVGISVNVAARLSGHKFFSHWFDDIVTITIENFETREEVEEAEIHAIQTEKPKFNVKNSVLEYRNHTKDNSILLTGTLTAKKLGVSVEKFYRMIKNNDFTVKPVPMLHPRRWRSHEVNEFANNFKDAKKTRKRSGKPINDGEYVFFHPEYGEIQCKQIYLVRTYSLSPSSVSRMVKGDRPTHKGWKCIETVINNAA